VYGPKLRADAARLARNAGASLIVCGHSHVPFIGRDRGSRSSTRGQSDRDGSSFPSCSRWSTSAATASPCTT
jgi:hypothetical protein